MKRRLLAFALIAFLAACGGGGGGGGGNTLPPGGHTSATPSPTPTPTLPPSSSQSATLGSSPTTVNLAQISNGASAQVVMPAVGSTSVTAQFTLAATPPNGVAAPAVQRVHKMLKRDAIGGTITPVAYLVFTLSGDITISQTPAFTLTFPAGMLSGYGYAAIYDEANPTLGWNVIAGPIGPLATTATTLAFPAQTGPGALTIPKGTYVIAFFETGTPLPTPTPSPTPTPTPSPTPTPTASPSPSSSQSPAPGNASPLPAIHAQQGWAPYDVANALAYPVQSGYNGSGMTVAIVMDSYPLNSDLASYMSTYGIPQTGRSITFTPSPDGTPDPTADIGEVTLDAETIAGLAPGANITVYGMPKLTQQNFTDTVNTIASNKSAAVISFSAGGCEYQGATSDTVLQNAATLGIAVIASSGDQGNNCYSNSGTYVVGVGYPASDPYVTGLGGTETTPQTTLSSNTVWNDFSCSNNQQCGGGGGVSVYFPLPSYQQSVAATASSSTFRNVPDVSMPAEYNAVVQNGNPGLVNGTSWSAPEYAALMAEVYQYCNNWFVNPMTLPYYVFQQNTAAFIDVTKGNDQYNNTTPFYSAGLGYDNASGIGVPIGMTFANTICPNRVVPSAVRAQGYRMGAYSPMPQHTGAFSVNATPHVSGLYDEGRRSVGLQTRVQIALRNSGNVASNESAVISSLRAAGFAIAMTFRNHLVVDAVAPSGTVEQYFGTELHNMQQGRFGSRYMPVRPAVVPASIAPYVSAINLDDVVTMHHRVSPSMLPF